jgi:DNA-binding beta-propeller fold protein YncE
VSKVAVGVRPNGPAYDDVRSQILVANVGDPAMSGSHTLTVVDVSDRAVRAEIPVSGRTRWMIFDPDAQAFYVNITDPAEIVAVDARKSQSIARRFAVPSIGPHGLDLDLDSHRLFCACDVGESITLDAHSGNVLAKNPLSGFPDVVFLDRAHDRLYVAVGDPGTIDIFDTNTRPGTRH